MHRVAARGLCLLAISLTHARFAAAQTVIRVSDEPPILALTLTNPWLMVIGSDSPDLAVFADGWIVRGNPMDAPRLPYMADSVGPDSIRALMAGLSVRDSDFTLPRTIDATDYCENGSCSATFDARSAVVYLRASGRSLVVSVYGAEEDSAAGVSPGSDIDSPEIKSLQAAYRQTPPLVRRVLSLYTNLVLAHPRPWLPAKLEIMLSPDPGRHGGTPWPEGWPALTDSTTVARREGQYSVFLPAAEFVRLIDLFRRADRPPRATLDSREWWVDWRYPFPGEAAWVGVIRDGK